MTFLGYVISKDELKMDNIGKVLNWPKPKKYKWYLIFHWIFKKKKKKKNLKLVKFF